jgi:hypothetical protein
MNNSIERGLRTGSLKAIQPVLAKWQRLNENKSWFDFEDAPWWYNERATLSIFAGAVWRCGGWVFEEFSTRKASGLQRGRINYKNGRCDIQFSIGESEFIAEAKQCWPTLSGTAQNARRTVEIHIAQANQEVQQVPEWGYRRLGIVFVAPRVHVSKQDEIDKYLQAFVKQLVEIKSTTIAWVFPKAARTLRPPSEENTSRDYIFPGVAVVLCPVIA